MRFTCEKGGFEVCNFPRNNGFMGTCLPRETLTREHVSKSQKRYGNMNLTQVSWLHEQLTPSSCKKQP